MTHATLGYALTDNKGGGVISGGGKMTIEHINPLEIKAAVAKKGFKGMSTGSGFSVAMLDAVNAMGPTAYTAGSIYGSNNSAAVLSAAFSGIGATSSQMGGMSGMSGASYTGTPYMSGGYGSGYYKSSSLGGFGGLSNPDSSAIPGTTGFSQMDMINTMNQNNLQLLELQAVMQNNMQAWNTKSNILSADHRARMAMIEKFTARG